MTLKRKHILIVFESFIFWSRANYWSGCKILWSIQRGLQFLLIETSYNTTLTKRLIFIYHYMYLFRYGIFRRISTNLHVFAYRGDIASLGVSLGVKTCEVFLCFLPIIFLGSIVLTSQRLLCIHCFTSQVFTSRMSRFFVASKMFTATVNILELL